MPLQCRPWPCMGGAEDRETGLSYMVLHLSPIVKGWVHGWVGDGGGYHLLAEDSITWKYC